MKTVKQKIESGAVKYPCLWTYKIIGDSISVIRQAVDRAIPEGDSYKLTSSRKSAGGKYQSFRLEIVVLDENHRNSLFNRLKLSPGIRFVI